MIWMGRLCFMLTTQTIKQPFMPRFALVPLKKPPSIQFYVIEKNRERTGNFPTLAT